MSQHITSLAAWRCNRLLPRALFLLPLLGLSLACSPGSNGPATPRHVVLVTLDTLRADHLGAYGGDVPTPHMDRLASEGVLFEQAIAHVPLTRPSHVALFSGLLPIETGIRDNVSPAAIPEVPLLAEVFQQASFETAAFVSSVVVAAPSGLDRGFSTYDDTMPRAEGPAFLNSAQRSGDETLGQAVAWLESHREAGRIFLWLHLYDPHEPYEAPEPFGLRFADRPYAGEVAWTDELIGRLDSALERLGLRDSTLLAVTSDHGEGLGQHGEHLHGFFVYESTLRVPLFLRGPGIPAARRLESPVGLVDLYPTLLELSGLQVPAQRISGRSLASQIRGTAEEPVPGPIYAESLIPRLHFGWSELRVVREGHWKYIQAPRPELYDLQNDPGEEINLLQTERRQGRALRDALQGFLAQELATGEVAAEGRSLEEMSQLLALGYLGGSTAAETSTPDADPKDKIEEFRFANAWMREGLKLLHDGQPDAAAARFQGVLERGIESAELHLYLGQAHEALGTAQQAAEHFRETVRRTPTYAEAWLGLARAEAAMERPQEALQTLEEARQVHPSEGPLYLLEATILRRTGRLEAAHEILQEATRNAPENAYVRAALAELLRDAGDLEGAVRYFRDATALAPEDARYWNALGMTQGGRGELQPAEEAFRRAWTLDARNHMVAYNLGLVLLRQGRAAEARPFFERCLELRPDFAPAHQQLGRLSSPTTP